MKCPECGYPHATPPKCRACGAEITEEMEPAPIVASEEAEPIVEAEEEAEVTVEETEEED